MKQHEEEYKRLTLAFVLFIFAFLILGPGMATAQESSGQFPGGSVKIGFDNRTCDGSLEGAVRYHSTNACIELCDGSAWACAGGGGCNVFTWNPFSDVSGAIKNTLIESDIVQIDTNACSTGVSISGQGNPAFRICDDLSCSTVDHDWDTANQSIDDGQYLQLRLTSSPSEQTTLTATVTIGSTNDDWSVSTGGETFFVLTQNTDTF